MSALGLIDEDGFDGWDNSDNEKLSAHQWAIDSTVAVGLSATEMVNPIST